MKIIGHQIVDFTAQNGDRIKFARIFAGTPIESGGKGDRVDVFKCSVQFYNEYVKDLVPGTSVELFFDRYQRVCKVDLVK